MWIVVGASAGLGRALATELARRGHTLLLAASDSRDLAAVASDLHVRFSSEVHIAAADASAPTLFADSLVRSRPDAPIDGILFPLGVSLEDDDGSMAGVDAQRLVAVNFLSVAEVVRRFLPEMVARRVGHLVGFGSVAAVRGRSRNVLYAASKRALASYFESLRHLAEPQGVRVSFWELGYMESNLSFGMRLRLPVAAPDRVARVVCRGLATAGGVHCFPRWWRPVSILVRLAPWQLFRRLRF